MSPLLAPNESERTATPDRSAAHPQGAPASANTARAARTAHSPQTRQASQPAQTPHIPQSAQQAETQQSAPSPRTSQSPERALNPQIGQKAETPLGAPSPRSLQTPESMQTARSAHKPQTQQGEHQRPSHIARKTDTPRAAQAKDTVLPLVEPAHLFALANDALVVVDASTLRIRAWNPRAENLFGYTATSAVDRPIDLIMPPDLARLHHERLAHFARTGDPTVLHSRSDVVSELIGKDARPRPVYVSVAALPTLENDGQHFVLFTVRPAQCAEASRAPDATTARCPEPEPAMRDLTEDELPTPPPAVDAAAVRKQLRRAQRTAAQLSRRATDATFSRERLACLARVMDARISALDRSLAAREDLRVVTEDTELPSGERVNLVPLFASLVAEFRTAIAASTNNHTKNGSGNSGAGGTGFRVNLAMPQGLTIQADPERIAYLIRFLLADARRRNPRGCWIDVDLRRPLGGLAHIGVRDYGRALSAPEQSRLPNQPTADDDWLLVHGIVMRMGGTITCDLPQEGGLRVGIDLPVNGTRPRPRPRPRTGE